MSDDFGLGVRFAAEPLPSENDIRASYPDHAHLENSKYNHLLKDYFACVTGYLNDFYDPAVLEN